MSNPPHISRLVIPLMATILLLAGCYIPDRDDDQTPVSTMPPATEELVPEPTVPVVTVTVSANVRSGPGMEYAVISWLIEGTEVVVKGRDQDGDWLQIEYGQLTGWVFTTLTDIVIDLQMPTSDSTLVVAGEQEPESSLNASPESEVPAPTTEIMTVTVVGRVVNLRTGPSTNYVVDGYQVKAGDTVQVVGRNQAGDWLQIIHPVNTGLLVWIFGSLTDISSTVVDSLPEIGVR